MTNQQRTIAEALQYGIKQLKSSESARLDCEILLLKVLNESLRPINLSTVVLQKSPPANKTVDRFMSDESLRPINLSTVVLQKSPPANKTVDRFMFDKSPEQILGKSWLLTWPDNSLSLKQFQQYSDYLNLRSKGMPVAYITGEKDFWTFTLSVTPDTLIPRPETELLVDYALEKISMTESTRLLELGTGSGAIALAIASERKNCRIVATDISYAALNIAKKNALSLKLSQVSFQQSSWFDSINEGMEFDMIISNPPYIAQDDPQLEHNVKKYEPLAALFAADNGLDDIKQIIKNAPDYLKESGWILLEHGYNQAEAVQSLLNNHAFTRIASIKDLNRQERITMAQLNEYKK